MKSIVLIVGWSALIAGLMLPMPGLPAEPGSVVGARCPYDISNAQWTGQTTVVQGITWYVMRCPQGHESLSRSPN